MPGGGGERAKCEPPFRQGGVKIFEVAQFNVFIPDVKKGGGGAGHFRFLCHCWQAMGTQSLGRTWEWSPTWSEIMRVGGFDPSAANRGAYAGEVHGIASRPRPKPKTPSQPAAAPPRQPPGRLHQDPGGNPPHPRRAKHGMLRAF